MTELELLNQLILDFRASAERMWPERSAEFRSGFRYAIGLLELRRNAIIRTDEAHQPDRETVKKDRREMMSPTPWKGGTESARQPETNVKATRSADKSQTQDGPVNPMVEIRPNGTKTRQGSLND